ncbi:hypothetical protein LNAOJCKE_2980 [Methylorubrum aminovorans]|uniref:Uncharacterized protein n=1 Tax=Methylorubrum aminovorans TaxID=269069 RepID=A0ABQ4UGX2_9HYPH|nr:hypothetical protein [Methylorubrum aminovorans]GJE65767.1 hypothetical protein LNAOJCKE_2980 [Methylorubrum aminovorans]
MIPALSMPSAPLDVRGGPGIRIERNNTSTIVSLSDVVLVTSGTGPDFIVSSPEGKIRLFDGLSLLLRMDRTGPNGPTLSVDGSPRAQWRDANGSPLADGVIQKDSLQRVVYDGTRGIWLGTQLGGPGTTGVTPDFTGTLGQRGAHDKAPQGTTFLAISDLPTGPEWTLYAKLSDSFGDWSTGLAIKASAAQTTVEAQAAAEQAAAQVPLVVQAGAEQVTLAKQQAQAAASQAAASTGAKAASEAARDIAAAERAAATQRASEAAIFAANAAAYAAQVGRVIFDFNFESEFDPTNDWNA